MPTDERRFQITDTGSLERYGIGTNPEDALLGLIKKNIDVLLPGLTNPSVFSSITDRFDEPHVVAFDKERKMLAVIVYKKEWDAKGMSQVQNYLKYIRHNKDEFKNIYLRQMKDASLHGFDWSDAYAVVVSLNLFKSSEIDLARDDGSLDLYKMTRHQDASLSFGPVRLDRVRPESQPKGTAGSDMFDLRQMYEDIRTMVIKEYGGATVTKNSKTRIEFRRPKRSGIYRVYILEQSILFEHYDESSMVVSDGEFEDVLPGLEEYLNPKKRGRITYCR